MLTLRDKITEWEDIAACCVHKVDGAYNDNERALVAQEVRKILDDHLTASLDFSARYKNGSITRKE